MSECIRKSSHTLSSESNKQTLLCNCVDGIGEYNSSTKLITKEKKDWKRPEMLKLRVILLSRSPSRLTRNKTAIRNDRVKWGTSRLVVYEMKRLFNLFSTPLLNSWIFDFVFLYFLWRRYLFTCSTIPIFLRLSSDQGNLCDNGVIVVFDQKFFFMFKRICKFALTAQYFSISVLGQVWHAFSSPESVFWI